MKISIRSLYAFLIIFLTVFPSGSVHAIVVPAVSDIEGKEDQGSSNSNLYQELKRIDREFQKIISETGPGQDGYKDNLESIKKELQKVESRLKADEQPERKLKESEKKPWIPARIAWALEMDRK